MLAQSKIVIAMPDPLDRYLSKKGGIELICEINPRGSSFSELEEALPISHETLARRLEEAREASLISTEETSDEHGTTHIHSLTPDGATLRMWLDDMGATSEYHMYNKSRKRFHETAEEVRSTAKKSPDVIFSDGSTDIHYAMEIKNGGSLENEDKR